MPYKRVFFLSLLAVTAGNVYAEPAVTLAATDKTQIEMTQVQQSTYDKLPESQKESMAKVWGITPKDYSHYLWLMQNTENAVYYANQHLDPTWILAINAKDKEELKRFTTQAIINERARLAKLLAFEHQFSRLQQELYPHDKPIASPNLKTTQQKPSINFLQPYDMLLLFADIKNTTTSTTLSRLLSLVQQNAGVKLNVYITDRNVTDDVIQQWAAQQHIPIDLVKKGIVTLNHDEGRFTRLTQNKAALPFVVLNRNDLFQAIDLNSL